MALVSSMVWALPAQAMPDWNLGNAVMSEVQNLNARASGVIRNEGVTKCLDDLGFQTVDGSTVASWTCNGLTNQDWSFTPSEDYYWDTAFYGTLTLNKAPSKCLSVASANGGPAQSVAVGGSVQMLLTKAGSVFAKSGVGLGGWTKESDFDVQKIAAGSDGTQMMVGAERAV